MKTTPTTPATEVRDIPTGEAAAAILAAGIGSLGFGVATVLAETYDGIARAINFYLPVGPLSGKTALGVGAWGVAWLVLYLGWKGKTVNMRLIYRITLVLVVLSLLLTLPPVFEAFKDVFNPAQG